MLTEFGEEKNGADPFDLESPSGKKKRPQKRPSVFIAYTAAATAIGATASVVTVFLPLRVFPLVLAAYCFFVTYVKCGLGYGLISAAATCLITFFCGGLSSSFILLVVGFFPYSLMCLLFRRFGYNEAKTALLRGIVMAGFAVIAFFAVFAIAAAVALEGVDLMGAVQEYGYAIAIVCVAAFAVVTDVLFVMCDKVVTPKIKEIR